MDDPVIQCMRYVIGKTCKTLAVLTNFLFMQLLNLLGLIFNTIAACTIVRLPGLWIGLYRCKTSSCCTFSAKWKWLGIVQILIFISDIPIMLMLPFLCVFPWRMFLVIAGTKKWVYNEFGYEGGEIRARIIKHFVLLVFDILAIPLVILVGLSWRCPIFIQRLKKAKKDSGEKKSTMDIKMKAVVTSEFLFLLIDIVCLPLFIVVLLSWRSPVLISKLLRRLRYNQHREEYLSYEDEFAIRWKCVVCFVQLFLDLLSIPAVILTVLSWRLIFLIQSVPSLLHKKLEKIYNRTRMQFWLQALTLVALDIPCLILTLLIIILSPLFPWRTYQLVKGVYTECFKSKKIEVPLVTAPTEVEQEVELEVEQGDPAYQSLVDKDEPSAVTEVVKTYKELPRSQMGVRLLIVVVFVSLLIDIPVIICGIIVTMTGWRLPFLVEKILKEVRQIPVYSDTYRSVKVSKRLRIKQATSIAIWNAVIEQLFLLVVDLISSIVAVIVFLTLWRAYPLYESIKKACSTDNGPKAKNDDGETETAEPTAIGDPSDNDPKTKYWTYCLSSVKGWKIRKQIFINLAFLLVDIPALILLLINCLFVIRMPSILSSIIGCGNIFMEFSFIIFTETGKLLVDLVFVVLFCALVFTRPVAIWVNTLEDSKHRKVREIRDYLVHINYVLKSKKKYMNKVDSSLSILIKENEGANLESVNHRYELQPAYLKTDEATEALFVKTADVASINFVRLKLSQITVEYTTILKKIRDEIFKKELDDKVIYYLSKVIFLENKLPYHLSRKFEAEAIFVRNASLLTRKRNIDLIDKEFFEYEREKIEAYELFSEYEIDKVPLWEESCGLSTRTRKETQKVLVDTLKNGNFVTFIICLINTLLIYRAPSMYNQIFSAFHLRRSIAQSTLKEYLLDLIMFLKVFMVIICIYRTPDLFSELTVDFFHKRSLTAARATVDRYPAAIFSDLGRLLGTLLSWQSIAYTFTSILMLLLLPLSIMVSTFKSVISSPILAYVVAVIFYLAAMISPFVIIFHIAGVIVDNDDVSNQMISHIIGGYWIVLIMLLLVYVTIKTKSSERSEKHVKSIDYVRVNWFNIHVGLMQFIELIEILALVFSVQLKVFPESNLMNQMAKYILLDVYTYEVKFIISVILFVIWFFVCSIPLVLEGVLEYVPANTFSKKHFTWRAYLSFFGSTLFMIIPEINMSFLACDYNCNNSTLDFNDSTIVTTCPYLYDSPNTTCWEGAHLGYASASFIMLVWYVLTAMMCTLNFTDIGNKKIDLQFSPAYSALVNIIKMTMIFAVTLYKDDTIWVLGALLILTFLTIILSFTFKLATGMSVANSDVLFIWRIESLVIVVIACLTLLLCESLSLDQDYILYSPWIVILVTILFCLLFSKKLQSISDQEAAKYRFKQRLKELQKKIESEDGFITDWSKTKHAFSQMLSVVRVANPRDKDAEVPDVETWLMTQSDGVPPPLYNEAMAESDTSAPPPDYNLAVAGPSASTTDDITDDYFVPSASNYVLSDSGDWTKYDAERYCLDLGYMNFADNTTKQLELTDVHCTGADLLLLIEQNIRYDALSLKFVQNIATWKNSVRVANWVGLEKYASFLLANATFDFTRPPSNVIVNKFLDENILKPSEDISLFPKYIPLVDISEIKQKIHKRELAKILEILPQPWKDMFAKLIPDDPPVVYKVTKSDKTVFELFGRLEITIKEVGPTGFKIAQGAKVFIPKVITMTQVSETSLMFGPPYPSGAKGPITKQLTSLNAKVIDGVPYIVMGDKRVKVSKVLDTLAGLSFNIK